MKSEAPIIVAITGASGVILAYKFIDSLLEKQESVFLVCSSAGRMVWKDEKLPSFGESIEKWDSSGRFKLFSNGDFYSPIASGGFKSKAMIVIPTSMNTIASISNGITDNLIKRAADVMIKEKRELVLVPRETPLNALHLKNMAKLAKLGVKILPPNPPYYLFPKNIEDVNDFIVQKLMVTIGVEDKLPSNYIYNEKE
tara:strand:+ start:9386 stop:9979 length:594 start_codon:yes stop_codon:yes gene_type:complete